MKSFQPFLTLLTEIEDPRRAEGKKYRLPHIVLFAILAMVSGANSYRGIHSFIDMHLARLRKVFGLKWRRAPAYRTIRIILQQLDTASVEQVFRRHAAILHEQASQDGQRHIAIDGKALRHSFDQFHDRKAAHILSAFASDAALVLAHLDCDEKSNEIPAVQALLRELGLVIAQVKDNQPTLHQHVEQVCQSKAPVDQDTSRDANRRSRDETRLVEVFDP